MKTGHKAEQIINEGSKIAKDLQKNAKTYGKIAITYIKKYPIQSTLIAATAGYILGKLFKR